MKVRVNLHGLFTVASASLTEKKETVEETPETMETEDKGEKVRQDIKQDDSKITIITIIIITVITVFCVSLRPPPLMDLMAPKTPQLTPNHHPRKEVTKK